jgi:hypothetical protein
LGKAKIQSIRMVRESAMYPPRDWVRINTAPLNPVKPSTIKIMNHFTG